MSRWLRPVVVGSLLSSAVAVSCIVSNVELVERLPGENEGGAGATATAGTTNGNDGGDDPGPDGGMSSGGSSAGRAGSSNSGGSNPTAGSTGVSGSGTGGFNTDPTQWVFDDKGACDTAAPAMLCDDFEQERATNWTGGLPGSRPMIADAPSGEHVWESAFNAAAMNVVPGGDGFSVSFWVRVPTGGGDHVFIDWSGPGHTALSFGIEGGGYRFRLASEPTAYSAPELPKYTRTARFDAWTCVELVYVDATFQATVTVLGEAPVKLALVGGTPDPGIDEDVLKLGASDAFQLGPDWTLGETGANLEFDDVRVVPLGQASVCQDFIAANDDP